MAKPPRSPFDVTLSEQAREDLGIWLTTELDNALSVKGASDRSNEYFHVLYEQGRTRGAQNSPWPDAADLTSAIGTEKVDALRSRLVRTVFSEQVWTVEGWGDSASKAPAVEEFHNWQVEVEGFQGVYSDAVHLALIETRGVIEVYEDTIRRPIRRQIRAALELNPMDGTALIGPDMQPVYQVGPDGKYVEVSPEGALDPMGQPMSPLPSADVMIDDYELVCAGPRERVIASRDFLVLPAHATEKSEVWGYAKRFHRSLDQLAERVAQGHYDAAGVEAMGTDDERASATSLSGEPEPVAPKEQGLAEKELWEVTFLKTLDNTGYRWFVATVHVGQRVLLRVQYDEIGRPRYFLLRPFPRPRSLDGYSFIGHKLITPIEENTAWRNMLADAAAKQVQAPVGRLQGALWDPDEEPIGPKSVITMRQQGEVFAIDFPDVTAPARERIIDTERQAEKLAGLSDIASGTNPNEDRTLGETQLIASSSDVRVDEVLRNIQEPLEEIAQVRHLMWQRALRELPDGMALPPSVLTGLETRGADVLRALGPNKTATAALLDGTFRFKPKGSVETANKPQQQRLFAEGINALASISGVNPMIGMILQQPQVAKALIERWIYLYGGGMDKSAFLGGLAMQLLQQQMATPGLMPGLGPQMGQPGLMPEEEPPDLGPMAPPPSQMGAPG